MPRGTQRFGPLPGEREVSIVLDDLCGLSLSGASFCIAMRRVEEERERRKRVINRIGWTTVWVASSLIGVAIAAAQ